MSERRPEDGLLYVAPATPPESRRPPRGTVGIVGWLRQNLFDGFFNTILTILTLLLIFFTMRELITWTVESAQWGVINNNLRLYNVGRYPTDQIWRIEMVAIILMFLSGIGLAIWGGASRSFFITAFVVTLLTILIPISSQQFLDPATVYFLVDEEDVFAPMRFVGDAGDEIEISVLAMNDNRFATDDPARGLLESAAGASNSRLSWSTIKSDVTRQLEAREAGESEDPTTFENYNLLLEVQLLDDRGAIIAETFSTPDDPNITLDVTLPDDSWYIINVIVIEAAGLTVDVDGISLPRTPIRASAENTGVAFIALNGIEIYTTRPDDIESRESEYGTIPALGEDGLEALDCYSGDEFACQVAERSFTFNGKRNLGEYLRIQLSPYLSAVGGSVVIGVVVFMLAYALGFLATQSQNPLHLSTVNRLTVLGWLLLMPISWFVLRGSEGFDDLYQGADFSPVSLDVWEGLVLTLILTFISVGLSLPLGVLLALGRQSGLPVIGTFCVVFIEVIRGAPLITILFFAKNIIPFFAASLTDLEDVIRMLVGLTLFSAAYQAEIVRGGLQIIPKGQTEAAQALGLNIYQTNQFIILPQALRAVIPASMSQFVSLFKDTSLVQIIGLFELLGVVELVLNGQQRYRLAVRETYLYIGIIYFIIAFIMSTISRRLEESGSGSARR